MSEATDQFHALASRLSDLWEEADARIAELHCVEPVSIIIPKGQDERGGFALRELCWRKLDGAFGIYVYFNEGAKPRCELIFHAPLVAKLMCANFFAPLYKACQKSAAELASQLPLAIDLLEHALEPGE